MSLLGYLFLKCDEFCKFCQCVFVFVSGKCVLIFPFFATFDLADKNSQTAQSDTDDRFRVKFKILLDGYRRMFDESLSKSKDLGDILRFLPGVVVQRRMGIEGMALLYRIKPDLLKCLIKFTIDPLKPSLSRYILDDYLSSFLQDRDRSQLYYCDPMLQHISICRNILSLLDQPIAFRR